MNPLQHALAGVGASEEAKGRVKAYLSAEAARRENRRTAPRLAAAFACLVLVLAGLGGWQLWAAPVSYISIDVNPSVELALNRFDRVVGTAAYNEDGARVLDGLSVRGKRYQEAIDVLFDAPAFRAYLDGEAKVVFTVVSDSEAALREGIQSGSGYLDYDSAYYRADTHCLEEAHAHGLSVGKYRFYEELSYYDSSITVEDCHDMTVGELEQELERCSGHGSGHDGGHHSGVSAQPEATPSSSAAQSPSPNPSISPSPAVPPSPSASAAPEQGSGHHGHSSGHH